MTLGGVLINTVRARAAINPARLLWELLHLGARSAILKL